MNKPIKLQGGKLYSKVVDRLNAFRHDYPANKGWQIQTSVYSMTDNYVVFIAQINDPDNQLVATGHGFNGIAKDKAFEKAETVAVGRALAFFDPKYGGDYELASVDEMEKFQEQKAQPTPNPATKSIPAKPNLNGVDAIVEKAMNKMNGTDSTTVMPFGKHKDTPIDHVPGDYIEWVLANMPQIDDDLRQELTSVLNAKRPELNG